MLPTAPLLLLTTLSATAKQPMYAVILNQGDSVDNSSTIVGITHDKEEADAYVAHQEAVLASILDKYKSLPPILAAWTAANPLLHHLPDQSYEDYYRMHGKWTVGLAECKRQWLTEKMTLEELTMDATMNNNIWEVEPLRWLPACRKALDKE